MGIRHSPTPERVKSELYASALRIAEKCGAPEHTELIYSNLLAAYRRGAKRYG